MGMKRTKVILTMAIATAFVLATGVYATHGQEAIKLTLMGAKDAPSASGIAELKANELKISAKGLKPNSVYTVWFVNMKPTMAKEGAGKEPYAFNSDANGEGKFEAKLAASPKGKWQALMIVRHPDGNPKNMDKVEDVLQVEIKG